MKKMLSMHRGWFLAAYVLGVAVSVFYFTLISHPESVGTANFLLFAVSHVLLFGALALAKGEMHIRYIWRMFAVYTLIVGAMFVVCPPVIGMVGSFALYTVIGYLHTRVLDLSAYLHALDPNIRERRNDKYALWVTVCVVSLVLFYWQCNFV